jgi:hypothetical protein
MSTVSLLKAMARERRPAIVVKVPRPSLSTLRRRSLPFWADFGLGLRGFAPRGHEIVRS